MPPTESERVPAFLGRVLAADGQAAGTCFAVSDGVLVTAWHVLDKLGAGLEDASVRVDGLGGGQAFSAMVRAVSPVHDLAVLTTELGDGLKAVVGPLSPSDTATPGTEVVVTGVAEIDDPTQDYRYLTTTGRWEGNTARETACFSVA